MRVQGPASTMLVNSLRSISYMASGAESTFSAALVDKILSSATMAFESFGNSSLPNFWAFSAAFSSRCLKSVAAGRASCLAPIKTPA